MTSIVAATTSAMLVPLQVRPTRGIVPDPGAALPVADREAAAEPQSAKVTRLAPTPAPPRAMSPTASPPLSPSVMAAMIEVQAQLTAHETAMRETAHAEHQAQIRAEARPDVKERPDRVAMLREAIARARAQRPVEDRDRDDEA